MIEHTFAPVEVAEGILRVTYPMPMKPGHVHGYLVQTDDGYLLVDAGLGLPEMPDHWAALLKGGFLAVHDFWGSEAWVPELAAWFARQGVPPNETAELLEVGSVYRQFVHFVPDARLLREGDEVAGWSVVELPGHADGHICLLKDGVLIAGDHLLPRITPAVGLYPDSRPDPLGDFMASLERVAELAPRLALPGHGDPIDDPAGRAREIVRHHHERLAETESGLRDGPRSGYELSCTLFPGDLGAAQRRFAVAEALSHLERLVVEGRAVRGGDDGYVTYTQP